MKTNVADINKNVVLTSFLLLIEKIEGFRTNVYTI